jgi:hypothetical protein
MPGSRTICRTTERHRCETAHRPCPQVEGVVSASLKCIEAQPKGVKEPALAVAWRLVRKYLRGRPVVVVNQWAPRYPRERQDEDDDLEYAFGDGRRGMSW